MALSAPRNLEAFSALLHGHRPWFSDLANASAWIYGAMEDVNWVGFYLNLGQKLVLGPFAGLPACTEIPHGKGVCGHAALRKETIKVDQVDRFPGHIACDPHTRSELVIPLMSNLRLWGVLDIDSRREGRFRSGDVSWAQQCAEIIVREVDWPERFD